MFKATLKTLNQVKATCMLMANTKAQQMARLQALNQVKATCMLLVNTKAQQIKESSGWQH